MTDVHSVGVARCFVSPRHLRSRPCAVQRARLRHPPVTIRPTFATGDLRIDTQIDLDNAADAQAFRFGLSRQFGSVVATVNGRETDVRRIGSVIEIAAPPPTRDVRLHVTTRGRSLKSEDEDRHVIDQDSLFLLWSDRF